MEKAEKSMMAKPNVIFLARAEGMGKNAVMISVHKDYADFSNFIAENLREWEDNVEDYDPMLISLKGRIVNSFSPAYLAEQEEPSED